MPQAGTAQAPAYSDAAKRLSAAINLHIAAQGNGAHFKIIAFRLDDGSCDPALYDTRDDAIAHTRSAPGLWAYAQISPTGTTPREAEAAIGWARHTYDLGFRIHSHGDAEPIMPLRAEEFRRQTARRR